VSAAVVRSGLVYLEFLFTAYFRPVIKLERQNVRSLVD